MKRILVCILFVFGLSAGIVGCSEKTQVKKTETVNTPGGSDTKTTTIEDKKTGDMKDNAGSTTPGGTAPANP
jgi:hypothetical protein